MQAVFKLGPSPIHRKTFAPIKHRPEVQEQLEAIYARRAKRKEEKSGEWWQVAETDTASWRGSDL